MTVIEYTVKVQDDGTREWLLNGKLHRENDLPAVEWANGGKEWRVNGKLHRENGSPAIECADGSKEWWVNGKQIIKRPVYAAEELTVAEISKRLGYEVKVVK